MIVTEENAEVARKLLEAVVGKPAAARRPTRKPAAKGYVGSLGGLRGDADGQNIRCLPAAAAHEPERVLGIINW